MEITCLGFLVFFQCQLPERAATDSFCSIYKPIHMSRHDTRKTKEQVDTPNRVWKRVCK